MSYRALIGSSLMMAMLAGVASALAQDAPNAASMQRGPVLLEASIGVMQGEANEYVYREDSSKLSQLVWAFDNVAVFNGGVALTPIDWFTLGIRARVNLTDDSTMDDYDWLRPGEDGYAGCPAGFCHSHHTDTQLTSYLSVDAYAAATLYRTNLIALKALAGYKRDSQSWTAFGGWANYTTFAPGQRVITYDQVWQAPYVGAQLNVDWNKWALQGRLIGSWWVAGKDVDDHHLRTLLFTEKFGESNMLGANAHVGYRLTRNLMLKGEYDLQQWQLAKGPSTNVNYTTGAVAHSPYNAAGGQSITQTISLGAVLEY